MKSLLKLTILVVASLSLLLLNGAKAEEVANTGSECVDLVVLFARGSSQNPQRLHIDKPFEESFFREEQESGRFFETFKAQLDASYPNVKYKAHSVHDFPGLYNHKGYAAVPIFKSGAPWLSANALNAEFSWSSGDYRESVANGADEVAGFVKHQKAMCEDQRVIMGGYSQGAHVIGEALSRLTSKERENISGVALFGDPKYYAEDKPWKRGTASNKDRGLADARIPYLPEDMERKTVSWCFKDDFICAGASGLRKNAADGHVRYAAYGIQQAAIELVQKSAPELYALERWRNGTDPGDRPKPPVPHVSIARPKDFMFLVNYSSGANDVISTLRAATSQVMPDFVLKARFGVADFSELGSAPNYIPRINMRQNLQWLDLRATALERTFYTRLSWGTWSGGGADLADPHILAIERLATYSGWSAEAIKHLVLITERPMKTTYTYNICNSSIRSNIGHTTFPCLTDPSQDTHPVNIHSDICDTAWQIITKTECTLGLKEPGPTYEITRTATDALTIAQANGIAVSIIVPHKLTHPHLDFNKEATLAQLENFAKSTGGLFIEYDVFNTASYSDMMQRVLGHRPKQLVLAHQDELAELPGAKPVRHVRAKSKVPITLDVSQSPDIYDMYKWDYDADGQWDETTSAPVSEHVFTKPAAGGFVRVAGLTHEGSGNAEALLTLPLTVEPYDGPLPAEFSPLRLPDNIKALKNPDDTIRITWENAHPGTIFMVADPSSGMPLYSAPAESGELLFQPDSLDVHTTLEVWLIGEASASPRQSIVIKEPQPDASPAGDNDKVSLAESSPWAQYRPAPINEGTATVLSAQSSSADMNTRPPTASVVNDTDAPNGTATFDEVQQYNGNNSSRVLAATGELGSGASAAPGTDKASYAKALVWLLVSVILLTSLIMSRRLRTNI